MDYSPHGVRNWLHHLLLAIQAADGPFVAACFAKEQFIEVSGPQPNDHWSDWPAWAAYLEQQLATIRPGSVSFRMLQPPTIQVDPPHGHLHWEMSCRLPAPYDLSFALACDATLTPAEKGWLATRLTYRLLPPSDQSGSPPSAVPAG